MNRAGIEAPPDYRPPRPWPLVALVLAALAVALGGAVQVWRDLRELERVRSSAAGPPVLGSLARVEGEASIRGARDLAWRVAGEGDRVHGLDRVRTGAGSGCLILPLDFPPIRVGERSLVELAGGAWGRALGGELRVDLGALEARLGAGGPLRIRTPAVALEAAAPVLLFLEPVPTPEGPEGAARLASRYTRFVVGEPPGDDDLELRARAAHEALRLGDRALEAGRPAEAQALYLGAWRLAQRLRGPRGPAELSLRVAPDGASRVQVYQGAVRLQTASGALVVPEGYGADVAVAQSRPLRRPLPGAPRALTPAEGAVLEGGSEALLSWEPVEGAVAYRVEVRPAGEGGPMQARLHEARDVALVLGDPGGGRYLWRVRALDDQGMEGPFGAARALAWRGRAAPPRVRGYRMGREW